LDIFGDFITISELNSSFVCLLFTCIYPRAMPLTLINSRYRIVRGLGRGGFGETSLVEDTQLPSGRYCVLKQLIPIEENPQVYGLVQERFQREAVILEELGEASDQIPRLYAYFAENHRFYLVQEYVEGETLGDRFGREGCLSEAVVREMLVGILPVLAYVHGRRMIHRDIKPDNIMVRNRDQKPVLIDFGAVRETMGTVMNTQGKSTQSIVIGTPGFMPSEQAAGRPTFASDLYSLGLTAIYLLTGRMPQDIPTDPMTGEICWRQFAPQVTPTFAGVLDRSVMPMAQARFQTAAEMLGGLMGMGQASGPAVVNATVISGYPGATGATVMSYPSGQQTVAAAPQYVQPQPIAAPAKSGMTDWTKAMIMGGFIGAFVLGGLYITRPQQTAANSNAPNGSAPVVAAGTPAGQTPSNSTNVTINPSPAAAPSNSTPSAPSAQQAPAPVSRQPTAQQPAQTQQSAPSSISQAQAEQAVQSWLQAKRTLMAPPYDLQVAHAVTTGPLLTDLTKSDGPVRWLANNSSEYRFGVQKIEEVNRFVANGDQANIEAWVTEDRTLYKNGVIDSNQTDFKTRLTNYTLQRVGGEWKVYDYKNISSR
jgi:serine/threonine protein kinase